MAYVNLTNTSGQVDLALRCSYDRLSKGFVGPLTENASSVSTSGFLIQDGNKNTGIFVANCSIQFCKSKIELKQDLDAFIILPTNRCLNLSGNNSIHSFSSNGTVSFGSGIDANYNGIQSYHPQPSLTLRDTDPNAEHAIRFLNSGGQQNFLICQSNASTCISGSGNLIFRSSGQLNSFHISGSNVSVSGLPSSSYGFLNYSNSLFSGASLFQNNFSLLGTGCISGMGNSTGLCVDSRSYFKNNVLISGALNVCNNNILTNQCVSGTTGFFNLVCIYNNLNANQINPQSVYVSGGLSNLSGNVSIFGTTTATGNSNLNLIRFQNSTGINLTLTGGNLNVSGGLNLTGALQMFGGPSLSADNIIRGRSFALCSTGIGNVNFILGNSVLSGNLNTTGSGTFSTICSTGSAINYISGCLSTCNDILSTRTISGDYVCAATLICTPKSIFGNFITGNNFMQTRTDTVSCFSSSGLNVGSTQTGYVGAINTSKAWGIIKMTDGVPNLCCGWNLSSTQVYSNVSASTIFGMGICFLTPIKYPFIVNFNVYGNNTNPLMISTATNPFITGNATAASALIGGGALTSPHDVELYVSGRCSSSSAIIAYSANNTYSEIFYNFHTSKGPSTLYSDLLKTSFDAIVHFNILGI